MKRTGIDSSCCSRTEVAAQASFRFRPSKEDTLRVVACDRLLAWDVALRCKSCYELEVSDAGAPPCGRRLEAVSSALGREDDLPERDVGLRLRLTFLWPALGRVRSNRRVP
ncbi:hypothetical protein MRX96_043770 [Rhipicephalus microplus]